MLASAESAWTAWKAAYTACNELKQREKCNITQVGTLKFTEKKIRDEFERWHTEIMGWSPDELKRDNNGYFIGMRPSAAWIAWKAAYTAYLGLEN